MSETISLETDKILAEVDDGIGWMTFNHPERRNAINLAMWQGIGDAFEAFQNRDDVRVVVMKGAGGKAFASGADISEFDQHRANAEQRKHYGATSARGNHWLSSLGKPLIAVGKTGGVVVERVGIDIERSGPIIHAEICLYGSRRLRADARSQHECACARGPAEQSSLPNLCFEVAHPCSPLAIVRIEDTRRAPRILECVSAGYRRWAPF